MADTDSLYPYTDAEVRTVVDRLLRDAELLNFLAGYEMSRLHVVWPGLARFLVHRKLTGILGDIRSVRDFQALVEKYVARVVATSMAGFEYEGLDHVPVDRGCVFISNHRDIAGDSTLVNYALHRAGRNTARIAVGDNLVQKQFATDLMRLNKSFFIKRSGDSRRQIYAALMESSRYINDSVAAGQSVWIAQAAGRAKDSMDLTDPAVVKMLTLASKGERFQDSIESLCLVPVTLSYEFDPCDRAKAQELAEAARTGTYTKAPGEDLQNLARGLTGFKGRVRLVFGEPMAGEGMEDPKTLAGALDTRILENLVLYPVNLAAAAEMARREPGSPFAELELPLRNVEGMEDLAKRLDGVDAALEPFLLRIYANPVLNRTRHAVTISQDAAL